LTTRARRWPTRSATQPDQWEAAVATAVGEFGTLNVLVNNAGTVALGQLRNFDLAKWQRVIDVNLTGTFLGMRAVVDSMTAAGSGSIINVSSIEGLRGAPAVHPYVASKWGVRGLAKSAALELAPLNIRVNSIHPGFIRTPMTSHLPEDLVTIPLGRPGEVREVATFVLFLASDESSYATGSEFVMDGGLVTDVNHKEF
jgi:3alpha(or 20beta)-hydroxysteroid dehydrogenase